MAFSLAHLPYSVEALVLGVGRSIGGIIPDVVISEHHVDEVNVTTHPVDTGAQVADHAFVKPASIHCQFGWTDSSRLINSLLDTSILKGLESAEDVYKKLLEMMQKREPIALKTKKRSYGRVVITRLETTTTNETENAMIIDISFQEILVATSQETTLAAVVDPSKHGSVTNGGNRYAQAAQT